MKIGILTYHRSNNYGALLQAIALRKVLSDMGHVVTFIDYWPAYHKHQYDVFSFHNLLKKRGIRGKCRYAKICFLHYKYRKRRKEAFDLFITNYIEPHISSMHESYDIIIHGSDQIWRKQPELNTYNPIYFGKSDIQARKKISYAASMGILPETDKDKQLLKKYFSYLNAISVRENSLLELLHSLGYQTIFHDLDPTLLLPSDYWEKIFKLEQKDDKYVLYYCLQNAFDIEEINKFALSKGLKLKIIYGKATCDRTGIIYTTSDPVEFLSLVHNSSFVFTSSFHGLVFSLIFHKPFLASFKHNAVRAESLLQSLTLSDHILPPHSPIPTNSHPVNYSIVDELIQNMREKSLSHLSQMIV